LWQDHRLKIVKVQRATLLAAPASSILATAWYLFDVEQTSKSAVSLVSKPAGRMATETPWKSAAQQVWKPALPKFGLLIPLSWKRGGKTDGKPKKGRFGKTNPFWISPN
jgi:hypothetical protein